MLPASLQTLAEGLVSQLTEYRDSEYRRALEDLLAVFGAAENDEQARERLEALRDDPRRIHDLLGHLNDLTFEVHAHARPAYLRVAAESLSHVIGPELARDAGLLLRRLSGRESSMLRRIVLESEEGRISRISDKFKNPLNQQQLTIADRVISRLVDAGLASHLPVPRSQLNPGTPQWGCRFIEEDGRRAALERYAPHLEDAL